MKVILTKCTIKVILIALSIQLMNGPNIMNSAMNVCFIVAFFNTMFLICDVVHKLLDLFAHSADLNQSNIDFWSAFYKTLDINLGGIIYNTACFILSVVFIVAPLNSVPHIGYLSTLSCLPCISLAWWLTKSASSKNSCSIIVSPVRQMKGLDYGTGMAYGYYYGYLRIILPSTGTTVKGFLEKIQIIEDSHNIKFALHKILILIPFSSYIPPDLKEASQQWMESAINLEEEERDRAGVKRRSYKNSTYKIYPGGRSSGFGPVYVVAEGATPLLTLYEIQRHSHPESCVYKEHNNEIVYNFYCKLQELIDNDPEIKDICEVIHYNDYTSKGKVNVAEVILQRISEIKGTVYWYKHGENQSSNLVL